MWLYPVPIGIGPGRGGGACNRELRRILLPRTPVNKVPSELPAALSLFVYLVEPPGSTRSFGRPVAAGSCSVRPMPTSDTPRRPSSRCHSTRYASSLVSRSPRISFIAFLSPSLFVVDFRECFFYALG